MPLGRGRRPPCLARGTDLEEVGCEEVDADESQLFGASPAGVPSELGGELHGVPSPHLRRAWNKLSLVSKASKPGSKTFSCPHSPGSLPSLNLGVSFPGASTYRPPPPKLHLLPNCPRSQVSPPGCLGFEFGLFPDPAGTPEDGTSQAPAPRLAGITPGSSKEPSSLPCPTAATPRDLQKQDVGAALEAQSTLLSVIHMRNTSPCFTEEAAHSYYSRAQIGVGVKSRP